LGLLTSAPKPIPVFSVRFLTIFSRPSKAPPQTNRMLVVVDLDEVWLGCLRPPCGGTESDRALEPAQQRLLHALARHVARDRRVVPTLREILSISSM